MFDSYKVLELLFYGLVDYVAYIPLVFYPFRKRIRYSKLISYSSMVLMAIGFLVMVLFLKCGLPAWMMALVSVPIAIGAMTWGLDVQPGQCATVLLMEYSNASFIAVMAKSIEIFLFPSRVNTLYGWTHSIIILMGVVLLYLFDYFVTWKILDPIVNNPNPNNAWRYIWITPLSFFIVWFIYTYSSDSYINGIPENPVILIMLFFFEIGSMITYFILIQLLHFESEKSRLEYQEVLNQSQYKNMSARIDEARKSRHDVRHHFLVLDTLAKEENLKGIREYLSQFAEMQASDNVLVYCEHFATNALLSYYSENAKEEDIEFTAKCNLPSEIGISNKDLTIIFSNLLENAIHACVKIEEGKRSIDVLCRYEDAGLSLRVKNTSIAAPKRDKNGRYLSTSHSGYGIGIESVQTIVKKYNGVMKMDFDGEAVTISIMLMV